MIDNLTLRMIKIIGICISALFFVVSPAIADTANLVNNGNFEQIKDGLASGWEFSSTQPLDFKISFPPNNENRIARINAKAGSEPSALSQTIAVKPHHKYRFSMMARVDSGKILARIYNDAGATKLDTRIYMEPWQNFPVASQFWDKKWISARRYPGNENQNDTQIYFVESGQWKSVTIDFDSGGWSQVSLSLNARFAAKDEYFNAGQYEFTNVSITEIPEKSIREK